MTQTTTTSRITIVNSWAESASLPTFMDLASTLSEKGDLLGDASAQEFSIFTITWR